MSAEAVARWESRSGKHWVELYADRHGYGYSAPGQGGSLGRATEEEALAEMGRRVAAGLFQPDAARTPLRRVR